MLAQNRNCLCSAGIRSVCFEIEADGSRFLVVFVAGGFAAGQRRTKESERDSHKINFHCGACLISAIMPEQYEQTIQQSAKAKTAATVSQTKTGRCKSETQTLSRD